MYQGVYIKNAGHLGCKYSHINVLKDAKNKNYKSIMICEDDVKFNFTFPLHINIPENWGMFYLGYYDYEMKSIKCNDSNQYCMNSLFSLMRLFFARSTFCYIVHQKYYDMIIDGLLSCDEGTFSFIDMNYAYIIQNKIPCYGIYPLVAITQSNVSTINENSSILDEQEVTKDILIKAQISHDKLIEYNFDLNKQFEYNGVVYNNFVNQINY
jgi:GR25 family glycosyltransferase involved in LPS biosynthesis